MCFLQSPCVSTLTRVKQLVRVEASLEGEASAALGAVEGLLGVGPVDGLVGLELQQLGEGFAAVFAAQRARTLSLRSAPPGLWGLCGALGPGGESRVAVIRIFWLKLNRRTKCTDCLVICPFQKTLNELGYTCNQPGSLGRHRRPGLDRLCTDTSRRTPGQRAPPGLPALLPQAGHSPEGMRTY